LAASPEKFSVKTTAIPLQVLTGPWDYQEFEAVRISRQYAH
jgi:hypothetical protein